MHPQPRLYPVMQYRCPVCGCFTTAIGDCDHVRDLRRDHCVRCGRFTRTDDPMQHTCPPADWLSATGQLGAIARWGRARRLSRADASLTR